MTAAYEEEERYFSPIEIKTRIDRQNAMDLIDGVNSIAAELKRTDISDDVRLKLDQQYPNARAQSEEVTIKYNEQYPHYANLRKVRDDAKAALYLLRDNQDLIVKHNAEYGVQTGPSLGSFYSIGFLKDQKDSIIEKIEGSLAKLERIEGDKNGLKDDLRVQRDEVRDKIRFLRSQSEIAMKILRDYERSQSIGARFMKSLYSYMPNTQI
ncbi:hypothetical protein BASA61_005837 [Batrachochytrium salamandrivorans]|nr:hypothetical protein BASA61_005837 [Batrachochytrium salamandrivorans]